MLNYKWTLDTLRSSRSKGVVPSDTGPQPGAEA